MKANLVLHAEPHHIVDQTAFKHLGNDIERVKATLVALCHMDCFSDLDSDDLLDALILIEQCRDTARNAVSLYMQCNEAFGELAHELTKRSRQAKQAEDDPSFKHAATRWQILALLASARPSEVHQTLMLYVLGDTRTAAELLEQTKYLDQRGLVKLEQFGTENWIAKLTEDGIAVVEYRRESGSDIARP